MPPKTAPKTAAKNETRLKGPQQLRNVVLLDGVAGAGVACVLIY